MSFPSVSVLDERHEVETLTADAFGFSYRKSKLEGRWIIGAELVLKTGDPASIIKQIDDLLQYRSRTQPLATSNCGSVFKNPPEGPAAQWIEKAGFKGMAVGGARVSERHANFIINEKKATARDVRELMKRIQDKVMAQFNVRLEPEVKLRWRMGRRPPFKKWFKTRRIGVLMGGTSAERPISLKTGRAIFASLKRQGFNARRY